MDRTTRRRGALVLALLVATAAAAAVAATAPAGKTLVVSDADSGEPVLEVPVEEGTTVTLSYTHSVEKTPVEDVYVVDGTELRMTKTVFHSHGAGLPTDASIERVDDSYVLSLNESYDELGVVPGSIAGHELIVGDRRYDLVERADGPVVLTVSDRGLSDVVPTFADRTTGTEPGYG